MSVGSDSGIARVRNAISCRQWLDALPADAGERLAAIGTLFDSLRRRDIGADLLVAMLEQVRIEQVRAIGGWLAPLAGRAVPYADAEWQRVSLALASLRAGRDLFKRAWSLMQGGDGIEVRSIIPGAVSTLQAVMPLARALDAQARIVSLLLRHRAVPPVGEWDALCVLARQMRRTTFQDESLADEVALVKPTTARALFVYPLLLQAASLSSRALAEATLADRLASRLAAKVGFRVDHGAPAENPYGPTLVLTPDHAVRLDTHRVPASLARRRRQWLVAGPELPSRQAMPLTHEAMDALFDDVERRWTSAGIVAVASAPACAGGAGDADAARGARLRFGLPRIHAADMQASGAQARARGGRRDARYEYGQWEQNTIIRLALGTDGERRDPAALVMAESEAIQRVDNRPGGRLVFERQGTGPRAVPGSLVAIAQESGLSLAAIESIEQVPDTDGVRLRAQRLTVRCWTGRPVPAGVKIGEAQHFVDAWLLPGDPATGELPSLVLAPGRAHAGALAVLREPDRDLPIRLTSLVARGPGYERLSLRIESPRQGRGQAGDFG